MYLRQPGFKYSACGSFTKNIKRIQNFKETRDSRYATSCSQYAMTYEDFKILTTRTVSDLILLRIQRHQRISKGSCFNDVLIF